MKKSNLFLIGGLAYIFIIIAISAIFFVLSVKQNDTSLQPISFIKDFAIKANQKNNSLTIMVINNNTLPYIAVHQQNPSLPLNTNNMCLWSKRNMNTTIQEVSLVENSGLNILKIIII